MEKTTVRSAAREISYTAMFVAIIAVVRVDSDSLAEQHFHYVADDGGLPRGGLSRLETGADCGGGVYFAGALRRARVSGLYRGRGKARFGDGGIYRGLFVYGGGRGACGRLYKSKKRLAARGRALVAAMVVGVALCYLFGTIWFIYVYNAGADTTVTFAAALMTCVVPYILPDLVKIVCAAALVTKLKKYMKL